MWEASDEDEMFDDLEPPHIEPQQLLKSADEYRIKILKNWIIIFVSRLRRFYAISDAVTSFILKF